jgi:hypothetical protein
MDALLALDPSHKVFKADTTYTLEDVQLVAPEGVNLEYVDGEFAFTATEGGKYSTAINFICKAENSESTFIICANMDIRVYDINDTVYVLDYNGSVLLNDSVFANDILPGTAYGLTKEETPTDVVDFECFTKDEPALDEKGLSISGMDGDGQGLYGQFSIEDDLATYTLQQFLNGADEMYFRFRSYAEGTTPSENGLIDPFKEIAAYKKITVMPANVIYYEDDFSALTYSEEVTKGSPNEIKVMGNENGVIYQDPIGGEYGSDDSFNTPQENGSGNVQHKIKVNGSGVVLTFRFTGTGFDIIGRSTYNSGSMTVAVYKLKEDGTRDTRVYNKPLITTYEVPEGEIYEIPLFHQSTLSSGHGNYEVEVKAVVQNDWSTGTPEPLERYLYIDGIRIYNSLDYGNDYREEYYADAEKNAQFTEVRNLVVLGQAAAAKVDIEKGTFQFGAGTVSYIQNGEKGAPFEGNTVSSTNDYLLAGPNNELYFNHNGQALVIYAKAKEEDQPSFLQIAVRDLNHAAFDKRDGEEASSDKPEFYLVGQDENGMVLLDLLASKTSVGYTEQYYTVDLSSCIRETINKQEYYRIVLLSKTDKAFAVTNIKHTNLEFYSIPGLAASLHYDKNGELFETSDPTAMEMPNLQQLAWQLQAAAGMLPGDEFEEEEDNALKFTAVSISLKSSIGLNYYILDEVLKDYTDVKIVVTKDTYNSNGSVKETKTYTLTDFVNKTVSGKKCTIFRFTDVPAKEMTAKITATIYAKDAQGNEVVGERREYNVRDYAMNMLSKDTSSAQLKTLLVDMLNYGSYAQTYFGYNTADLANSELTPEQKSLASTHEITMTDHSDRGSNGNDYPASFYGLSISLKDAVGINFYTKVKNDKNLDVSKLALTVNFEDVSGKMNSLTIPVEVYETGETTEEITYKVPLRELGASDMRNVITAWLTYDGEAYSNMVTYSIESYAYSQTHKEGCPEDLRTLLEAMLRYGDSTVAYFTGSYPQAQTPNS